ncbi:MAG: TlpA family protein disulfide reductase [candidate division WOR-3 bacterium]|nr:TlpA family protein disulfide reductase [candidate division WOR-3 bacterium]
MKKVVIIFIVIFSITNFLYGEDKNESFKNAPTFKLYDVYGNLIVLDSLVKKGPVIMSFWAVWCKMCIKELDALKPYYSEIESLGCSFLAISQDKAKSKNEVKSFAAGHKWQYQIVLDPENLLRKSYNVQVMPTFFIVNQDKKIVFVHQGYKPGDEKKIIEKIRQLTKKCTECQECEHHKK